MALASSSVRAPAPARSVPWGSPASRSHPMTSLPVEHVPVPSIRYYRCNNHENVIVDQTATPSVSSISQHCQNVDSSGSANHRQVDVRVALKDTRIARQKSGVQRPTRGLRGKDARIHHHIFFPITATQFALQLPSHHRLPSIPILPHSLSHSSRVRRFAL